jgi:hypothetical protein
MKEAFKLSPIRQSQDTKKIRSILRPSILRLFFGSVSRLIKGIRKYRVATYFERVKGPPFLFVPSPLRITKVRRIHLRIK